MDSQQFIEILCGRKSRDLCQFLAIAHINSSVNIQGGDIHPYEAHKYLIGNLENPQQYDFSKSDWLALRKELTTFIKDNKSDKSFLDNQISELIMAFTEIACYFFPSTEMEVDSSVHKLFNCIVETYLRATANHSPADYAEILSSSEATSKWNRESLQAIAKIGVALRKFANLLQGCIYANGLRNTVSHYQKFCGVTLATEFTNATIADATYWTMSYTEKVCKIRKPSYTTNLPFDTIMSVPELKQTYNEGYINEQGVLQCSIYELIRYFCENNMFLPMWKRNFKRIDGLLKDEEGKPLSCETLSQAASHQESYGKIDHNQRYSGKKFIPQDQ